MLLLGQTAAGEDPASVNREALVRCLKRLALNAQAYYYRPLSERGGAGSFMNLTLGELTLEPVNAYGVFTLSPPAVVSAHLTGVGRELGYDGTSATEVEALIFSDSVQIAIVN
jgi:hypothetical protein